MRTVWKRRSDVLCGAAWCALDPSTASPRGSGLFVALAGEALTDGRKKLAGNYARYLMNLTRLCDMTDAFDAETEKIVYIGIAA